MEWFYVIKQNKVFNRTKDIFELILNDDFEVKDCVEDVKKKYEIKCMKVWISSLRKILNKLLTLLLLLLLLLFMVEFFFFTNSSALLISSKVTPCVERLVSRTRLAWALRCVSLSSSRTGGTKDLNLERN